MTTQPIIWFLNSTYLSRVTDDVTQQIIPELSTTGIVFTFNPSNMPGAITTSRRLRTDHYVTTWDNSFEGCQANAASMPPYLSESWGPPGTSASDADVSDEIYWTYDDISCFVALFDAPIIPSWEILEVLSNVQLSLGSNPSTTSVPIPNVKSLLSANAEYVFNIIQMLASTCF